jgi:hypothetical protein
MLIECPTCSQTGAERSNPQGEVLCGEPASRNASELDSASLHYRTGAANLSQKPKWSVQFSMIFDKAKVSFAVAII